MSTTTYTPTPAQVELAKGWYAGAGSALYAIASTGHLTPGRPAGTVTLGDLLGRLRYELTQCLKEAQRVVPQITEFADLDELDAAIIADIPELDAWLTEVTAEYLKIHTD